MIKNDIEVIKKAIIGEEYALPKKQILNNSIKINSNRNLNLDENSLTRIKEYKQQCLNKIFNDFEIYFDSIFNSTNLKQSIFEKIKNSTLKKARLQDEINTSIDTIKDFYKNNSIKEEIFKTHFVNKESINFGKVSNFFHSNILKTDQNNSYKENKIIGKNQDTYFSFYNKDLISTENFKKYFLINIEEIYDTNLDISNIDNVNINTYICQNFINVTRSLFTLHTGTLENVPSRCISNIANNSENLICATSEINQLNFFKYNSSENMSFDYKSFYINDYKDWTKNRPSYENLQYDEITDIEGFQDTQSYDRNDFQVRDRFGAPVITESASSLSSNNLLLEETRRVNVSPNTFSVLNRFLLENASKTFIIYDEFYKLGSKINENGNFVQGTNQREASYSNSVKEIAKSFSDIYSLNINSVNAENNAFLKKWIFIQGKLKNNSRFTSDIDVKENNLYNSINFDSIASSYLERYQRVYDEEYRERLDRQSDAFLAAQAQGEYVDTSNVITYNREAQAQEIRRLLGSNSIGSSAIDSYDSTREQRFYSTFENRFGNIEADSAALRYLSVILSNNTSMLYYKGRPLYQVKVQEFRPSNFNLTSFIQNQSNNDYIMSDNNILNTRLLNGSNYLSLKTDCIVKKAKIRSLKMSNIDMTMFQEISDSINDKITKNKIVSYSNDINSNLTLANTDELLFKLLFTSDEEDNFYSNFSITHKDKSNSNFLNYIDLIKNNVEPSSFIEDSNNLIKSIISNYYKGNYFKTSSCLLKNIIADVLKESKSIDDIRDYDNIALCQYLYMNYYKNKSLDSTEETSHDIISKRFVKKAIEKSRQYTGNKDFKEFKYDSKSIDLSKYFVEFNEDIDDANKQREEDKRDFLEKYHSTNNNLNSIRKSVFSIENLNNILNNNSIEKTQNTKVKLIAQEEFNKLTQNVSFLYERSDPNSSLNSEKENIVDLLSGDVYNDLSDKLLTSIEASNLEINFDLMKCVLPFKYLFKKCILNKNNSRAYTATSNKFQIENCDPFSENIYNIGLERKVFQSFGEVSLDKNYKKGNISINCLIKDSKNKLSNSKIKIEDKFEDIFESNSSKNTVFNSIKEKILDLILTVDYEFRKKDFKTELEVDEYIEENSFLVDLVTELLEVYSLIYCFYIDMLNQETTLRILSYSANDNDKLFKDVVNFNINTYLFDLKTIKESENITWGDDVLNAQISEDSVFELERLYNKYTENISDFIDCKNTLVSNNNLDFTKSLEKVLKTLTTSDAFQSISFDLLMQNFNFYLNKNKKIDYEDFKEKIKIDDSNFNLEKIVSNIFDKSYMNSFYKRKLFLKHYNDLFKSEIEDIQSSDSESLLSMEVFKIDKQRESRKILALNSNSNLDNSIINSDLYSYVINLEDLKQVDHSSLIKLKIEIIDHSRLDRIFLPKVLYFSPLLFTKDFISGDNTLLGFYDITQDNDDRTKYIEKDQLKSLSFFRNNIVEKFDLNSLTLEGESLNNKYDLLIEDIFNNHMLSGNIENYMDIFYNLKLDEKQISNKISIYTYNIFNQNISNDTFFDIFNTNKDMFIQKCFEYNAEEDCYFINSKENKYDKIVLFIKYLENIVSEENDNNILNNIENYINLNFSIATNNFHFILNRITTDDDRDDPLERLDPNTSIVDRNSISSIDKIKYYLENIDLNSNFQHLIYKFGNIENVDNYSISINVEVV